MKVKRIYIWTNLVYPKIPNYLCFTANTAWSTIRLIEFGTPNPVTLETSTNGLDWTTYTIWDTITLSNIWDKIYWRNTSETDTRFSRGWTHYYNFKMTWSIAGSWDVSYLLNKNSTDTLSTLCFISLFSWCSSLTSAPSISATKLNSYCCTSMFGFCTWLMSLPKLPATTLSDYCYQQMFIYCSNIKLSSTQTWDYQTAYRIPVSWTWTAGTNSLNFMFDSTGWTFTWTPTINTTYYTSNTVV